MTWEDRVTADLLSNGAIGRRLGKYEAVVWFSDVASFMNLAVLFGI